MNSNIEDKLDLIIKLLKVKYPSIPEDVFQRTVPDHDEAIELRKENEDLRSQIQFYTTAIEAKSKEEAENSRRIINDQRLMQDTLQQLKDGINSVGEQNDENYKRLNDVINNFQETVEGRLNEIQDKLTSNGQLLDDLCDLNSPFQKAKGANDTDYLHELFVQIAGDWRILIEVLEIPPGGICEETIEDYELFRRLMKSSLERQENRWSIADLYVAICVYGCPVCDVKLMPENDRQALRNASARLSEDLMNFEIIELHLVKEIDLSLSNKHYIKKTDTRHDQVIRLLDILQVKGDNAYGAFCKALEASGQDHLADYLKEQRRLVDEQPASNNREESTHSLSGVLDEAQLSAPVHVPIEEHPCPQDELNFAEGNRGSFNPHEISVEHNLVDIPEDEEQHVSEVKDRSASSSSDDYTAGQDELLLAAKEGNVARVSELLTQGADPNTADKYGHTGLHIAARQDNVEVAATLLDGGAYIGANDGRGRTALHTAANKGSLMVTNFLLKNNSRTDEQDNNGFYPLHFAALVGREEVVRILLDNGSPQGTNKHGRTPLHLASQKNHLKIVELLLVHEENRDVSMDTDNKNYTSIHHAAMAGHKDIINRLLIHNNTLLNAKCEPREYTSLHLAAKYMHAEVVEELLRDNIQHINDASPDNGYTPLHLAAQAGGIDTVRVLLRHGAMKDVISHAGNTPLSLILAQKSPNHDVVALLSGET